MCVCGRGGGAGERKRKREIYFKELTQGMWRLGDAKIRWSRPAGWRRREERQIKPEGSLLLSLSFTEHIFVESPPDFYGRQPLDSLQ